MVMVKVRVTFVGWWAGYLKSMMFFTHFTSP